MTPALTAARSAVEAMDAEREALKAMRNFTPAEGDAQVDRVKDARAKAATACITYVRNLPPSQSPGEVELPEPALANANWIGGEIAYYGGVDERRVPSYDALMIIAQSVCGALERAGITDCDDPGEAIDVLREGYERRLSQHAGGGERK